MLLPSYEFSSRRTRAPASVVRTPTSPCPSLCSPPCLLPGPPLHLLCCPGVSQPPSRLLSPGLFVGTCPAEPPVAAKRCQFACAPPPALPVGSVPSVTSSPPHCLSSCIPSAASLHLPRAEPPVAAQRYLFSRVLLCDVPSVRRLVRRLLLPPGSPALPVCTCPAPNHLCSPAPPVLPRPPVWCPVHAALERRLHLTPESPVWRLVYAALGASPPAPHVSWSVSLCFIVY